MCRIILSILSVLLFQQSSSQGPCVQPPCAQQACPIGQVSWCKRVKYQEVCKPQGWVKPISDRLDYDSGYCTQCGECTPFPSPLALPPLPPLPQQQHPTATTSKACPTFLSLFKYSLFDAHNLREKGVRPTRSLSLARRENKPIPV